MERGSFRCRRDLTHANDIKYHGLQSEHSSCSLCSEASCYKNLQLKAGSFHIVSCQETYLALAQKTSHQVCTRSLLRWGTSCTLGEEMQKDRACKIAAVHHKILEVCDNKKMVGRGMQCCNKHQLCSYFCFLRETVCCPGNMPAAVRSSTSVLLSLPKPVL